GDSTQHYLKIKLVGNNKNTAGIGAKVTIYAAGKKQFLEQMPSRGYLSSVSHVLHFGLGKSNHVDSVKVVWQSGKQQVISKGTGDRVLYLYEKDAMSAYQKSTAPVPIFTEMVSEIALESKKNAFNDFKRQPLLI